MWWALKSPPLFSQIPGYEDVIMVKQGLQNEEAETYLDFLHTLDKDPSPIQKLWQGKNHKRLGRYFEHLLFTFIKLNPNYRLIFSNKVIKVKKQSIGELDLVFQDLQSGEVIHMELAVKFYLGLGDTSRWENWYGPSLRDRLDFKMDKLLNKQIKFSNHPSLDEVWQKEKLRPTKRCVLLKGYLFYPTPKEVAPEFAFKGHNKSQWMEAEVFSLDRDKVYKKIPKLRWLSKNTLNNLESDRELKIEEQNFPNIYGEFDRDGREKRKIFICPKTWSEKLNELLSTD
ncbi:MAG: DUF1853 family protein [Bacteroidia bacterium]|nr:DUF1853 family protein [Bacteroidia bacterium]